MLITEIRRIMPKKLLIFTFALLFAAIVTLAFIPHYSCACADEGTNQVAKRSKLKHYTIKTLENIAKAIRPIFN